jgi:hypothetical protein
MFVADVSISDTGNIEYGKMIEKSIKEIERGETYTFKMDDLKAFAEGKYNREQLLATAIK